VENTVITPEERHQYRKTQSVTKKGSDIASALHPVLFDLTEAAEWFIKGYWDKCPQASVIDGERLHQLDKTSIQLIELLRRIEIFVLSASIEEEKIKFFEAHGVPALFNRDEIQRAFSLAYHLCRNDAETESYKNKCDQMRSLCFEGLQALNLTLIPWELARQAPKQGIERTL